MTLPRLRAIGKKGQLGEYVAVEFVLAAQTLNAAVTARATGFFSDLGNTYSAGLFVTHASCPSKDSTAE